MKLKKVFQLLLCTVFLLSCKSQKTQIDSGMREVFSGFTYVGSVPASFDNSGSPKTQVGGHGIQELPLPSGLIIGQAYIFHHTRPINNEELGLKIFPQRITDAGRTLINAPHSSRELIALFVGGPLFKIQFKDHGHIAYIFNQVCPSYNQLTEAGFSGDDYVLVYVK